MTVDVKEIVPVADHFGVGTVLLLPSRGLVATAGSRDDRPTEQRAVPPHPHRYGQR